MKLMRVAFVAFFLFVINIYDQEEPVEMWYSLTYSNILFTQLNERDMRLDMTKTSEVFISM